MNISGSPDSGRNVPNQARQGKVAWLIFKFMVTQLLRGTIRLIRRTVAMTLLLLLAMLRLMGSSAASGRAKDEFYDLAPRDSPDQNGLKVDKSDAFWSMYHQTYNPRGWRMRRLLTMSVGRYTSKGDREGEA